MLFIWAFLWFFYLFFFFLSTAFENLLSGPAWGKAWARQGCGTSPGAGDRNAALTGMWGCITVSVDFRDQFFVWCPVGRIRWEGRSSQGPAIHGLKLPKYTGTWWTVMVPLKHGGSTVSIICGLTKPLLQFQFNPQFSLAGSIVLAKQITVALQGKNTTM